MTTDIQSTDVTASRELPSFASARAILDALPAAVLVVETAGTVRYRNATARQWLIDTENVEAALANVNMEEPFEGWSKELSRIVSTHGTPQFTGSLSAKGASSPVLTTIRCAPFDSAGVDIAGDVIILLDKTPRDREAEQRIEMSNRLASLGKLAAKVAHELSNPLDGILRYVNLAIRISDDAPESKIRSYLTESRTGLMRMIQIIGDLLEYSRTTDGAFDAADINQVVEQAIVSQAVAADKRGVVIAADYRVQEMPFVVGTRLYQICCNLLKNAIDAMVDGGHVSITTAVVDEHVVIEFADTGPGLPDDGDAIFELFYTTKEPGTGTGLGLAICKEYVEAMQGTITAAPGDEVGAVFTVRIPVSACQHRPSVLGAESQARNVDGRSKSAEARR